jgi:chitinase
MTARVGVLACIVACALSASGGASPLDRPTPIVGGYLAAWSADPESIAALPVQHLTHVIYAFASILEDGTVGLGDPCRDAGECAGGVSGGNFEALRQLKQEVPNLQILISLGGWMGSRYISDAAATPEARDRFVDSAIQLFMVQFGNVFDGIDLDWEYPVEGGMAENRVRPEDRRNLTLLMAEFRRRLDELPRDPNRPALLTMAASASPWHSKNLEIAELAEIVDWICIMGYDYHAGASIAGLNAPLFAARGDPSRDESIDTGVQAFLAAGAPARKLVLGVPFYGRAYGDVAPGDRGDGLFEPASPDAAQGWDVDGVEFRALMSRDLDGEGYARFWHDNARVPWLYNAGSQIWISFDDPKSIGLKADYARVRGLRGIIAWHLDADDGRLIEAAATASRR